ncbi:MAG: DUF262 domain-containing protein, partial [Thermoguttaceae bacterium]|nr:DUF262 domain-containing protein [Thermoguttaceae bacterium]
MKIDKDTLLSALYGDNLQRVVPLFQRDYVWNQTRWARLWDSLRELYEDEREDPDEHFMGAVVLTEISDGEIDRKLIIDGQQRLTTISILLCALRDVNPNLSAISDYLVNESQSPSYCLRLYSLKESDRTDFTKIVDGRAEEVNPKSKIGECYRFFKNLLATDEFNGAPINTRRLYDLIEKKLTVAVIELGEADAPHEIFESLNGKGRKLDVVDLVRNFVLWQIPAGERENYYIRYWRPVEENIRGAETDFFTCFLQKETGERGDEKVLYQAMRDYLQRHKEYGTFQEKLAKIERDAANYRAIADATPGELNPGGRLEIFKTLKMTQPFPCILKWAEQMQCGELPAGEYAECLDILGGYYIRRMFCSVGIKESIDYVLKGWTEGEVTEFTTETLIRILDGLGGKTAYPTDFEFRRELTNPRNGNKTAFLALLTELERDASGLEDFDGVELEFVMPRELTDDWRRDLGAGAEEICEKYSLCLGNAALRRGKSRDAAATFSEKRERFAESAFALNRELANYRKWGAKEIAARAENLAERAIERWPRRTPGSEVIGLNDDWRKRRIVGVEIAGEPVEASYFTDVYVAAMAHLRELAEADGWDFVAEATAEFRKDCGREASGLANPREVSPDFFVALPQSPEPLRNLLRKFAEYFG